MRFSNKNLHAVLLVVSVLTLIGVAYLVFNKQVSGFQGAGSGSGGGRRSGGPVDRQGGGGDGRGGGQAALRQTGMIVARIRRLVKIIIRLNNETASPAKITAANDNLKDFVNRHNDTLPNSALCAALSELSSYPETYDMHGLLRRHCN